MVGFEAFRQDLAASLLRGAERRRSSYADRMPTGEDIKVVALLERLADDVKNLDPHVFLTFELMFTHKRLARQFMQQREDLLAQLGVLYCPSSATDLVRWLTSHTFDHDGGHRSRGSRRPFPVAVRPATGRSGSAKARGHGLLRSCVSDFSAGFGLVAPLLSLWNLRAAFGQWHDSAFMADHASVPATVVSVSAATAGRSIGSASDVVLTFRPPSGEACRVTWHTGYPSLSAAPGDTLPVVPRSTGCEMPLIPSQIGDPMQTLALAAALMAGGLASLKLWAWLFRHPPRPISRPEWPGARTRRHDLA